MTNELYWRLPNIDHVPELAPFLLEVRELNQRGKYLLYDPLSLIVVVRKYLYRDHFQDPAKHPVHNSRYE